MGTAFRNCLEHGYSTEKNDFVKTAHYIKVGDYEKVTPNHEVMIEKTLVCCFKNRVLSEKDKMDFLLLSIIQEFEKITGINIEDLYDYYAYNLRKA